MVLSSVGVATAERWSEEPSWERRVQARVEPSGERATLEGAWAAPMPRWACAVRAAGTPAKTKQDRAAEAR
jgi:hypothetical protein